MRVDIDIETAGRAAVYRLLTSVVVPRPIAWVSTVSEDGTTANLAPHSFFTIACVEPPIVQFTSVGRKDTLRNVEATGEFVVSLAPEGLERQINETGADFPPGVDEFDAVGLAKEPSLMVKAPRVADSPVALECRLHGTLRLGDSTIVLGRVVHAAVGESVLDGDHPEITRMRPLSRLGRDEWGTVGGVRSIPRVAYADWRQADGAN
ncbi:flavin reductase family protein [Streptomyces sp. NPDC021100]|uniref:flavin reductase family protein n=1 Tax=Streptomyces sp. NPDC021100 TaxID=3365114 RepID=UPI0037A5D4B9